MTVQTDWRPREITPDGRPASSAGLIELLADGPSLDEQLIREKALVFRGFGVAEAELERVLDVLLPDRLAYRHGTSPRTKVGGNVYTSTEYARHLSIPMHNELSYSHRWPSRLVFSCVVTPGSGGATPLVDGTLWLDRMDDEIRQAFAGGVRYTQNLHDGIGLGRSWQQTFETDDRAAVEEFLDEGGFEWKWTADGLRMVSAVRPSTIRHPVTGDEVWFNQAEHFHPAALGDETARELAQLLPPEELPQSVTFADGSPIPDEHIRRIVELGLDLAVDVDWRQGDLMIIDNVAVGHGRRPFTGDRRVLVAMAS
jgi:alpha-ketoglutarate-dependent taurine dioxygenase